jgi:hypothetical protein
LTDLQSAANAADIKLGKVSSNVQDAVDSKASKSSVAELATNGLADCEIIKSVDESRVTVGLAYPHNKADVAVAADGHIDFAGKTAIEKACWAFTAKSRSIGLSHANGTEGHGTVVESGIHRGPDWVIKGDSGQETVIKDGDWVLAVQWDRPTWTAIKSKRYNGFSPQGRAKRGTPSPEQLAELRSA